MAKQHDGSDYKHRQRILPHYQIMVISKKRLKFTAVLHALLAMLMAAKLLPTVLDQLNIFWQPLEELMIPMAKPWEWLWFGGVLMSPLAFRAAKSNSSIQIKLFLLGIFSTCLLPLLYCVYIYGNDFRTFVITRDASKTSERWRDYPVAFYWYIFIGVATQVHLFELYFASELLKSMGGHRATNKSK